MKDLLENLKRLRKKLDEDGYEIDHYEIRERRDDYGLDKGIEDEGAERVIGSEPVEALEKWQEIGGDEYVIEVFLGGRNTLDRVIYDSETGESDYLSFSGSDCSADELLEEPS